MRTAALIRTVNVDSDALRLRNDLESYFGDSIYFMLDRYHDITIPSISVEGNTITVGRAFLEKNNLPYFKKIGWQCGDIIYYVAIDILPFYDGYWLVEPDVSFRITPKSWFARMDESVSDFLAYGNCKSGANWYWYNSIADFVQNDVYGCVFPLSRMRKNAVRHLLVERRKYSSQPEIMANTWAVGANVRYANDEAFTASVLKRDGFSCEALNQIARDEFAQYFSTGWPVHPKELPFISNAVVHPVCSGTRALTKFKLLARNLKANEAKLRIRYAEFSARIADETWEDFTSIPRENIGFATNI